MKTSSRIVNAFAAMVALAVITQSASAVQIGLGAGLAGATNLDSAGARLNVEGQSTFLTAGTYRVDSFEYLASATPGNAMPFLAVSSGTDQYTVIWAGPNDPAHVAGVNTEAYTTQFFTLATGANVFAGINVDSNFLFFADPDGPSTTDHNNPANFALVAGSGINSFTNANLSRNYAFAVNVTQVIPEPATATLGLLAVGGLLLRRRRMA